MEVANNLCQLHTRSVGKPTTFGRPGQRRVTVEHPNPNLGVVGIAARNLAHAVRLDFLLQGGMFPIGDLDDKRIEVSDKEGVPRAVGVFRLLNNVDVPLLC